MLRKEWIIFFTVLFVRVMLSFVGVMLFEVCDGWSVTVTIGENWFVVGWVVGWVMFGWFVGFCLDKLESGLLVLFMIMIFI